MGATDEEDDEECGAIIIINIFMANIRQLERTKECLS